MILPNPRISRALASASALALLAGCVAIPKVDRQFHTRNAAELGLKAEIAAPVAADWWKAMGDPQLDRIMADALAGNPGLDEAAARERIAQALIGNFKGGLLPDLALNASTTDQLFSKKYIYPAPLAGSWQWMSNAQADLGWSLDLAGRQKTMVQAAKAFAHVNDLEREATRVSISGSVAQAYINLARAEAQGRLARDFVASREATLKLIETRRAAQLTSEGDVVAARALLAQARQAVVRADGARVMMVHALAALAGRGPDYYATIQPATLHFDAALPVPQELPADLLGRRADLVAARVQVDVALAGQKIAKAEFYPNINLRAFIGTQALGIGSAFTGSALTAGVGPAIHLPIFSGGSISARYKASVAGSDMAVAQYNSAVVKAVREAADALSAVETNRADAQQQRDVVASLEKTVALDRLRNEAGLSARFDVLGSGERLLTARQSQLDLAADGALRRVQLLVALGGGFSPPGQGAADKNKANQP